MTEVIQTESSPGNSGKFIRSVFLILIFSLSVGTPLIYALNQRFALSDFIFPFVSILFLSAIVTGVVKFRWHKFYWLLLFYFAAMLFSAAFSVDRKHSFIKLAGETYLIGLAVLTFNLVRTEQHFRQSILVWLSGTLLTVLVGIFTILLFYIERDSSILSYFTSIYGAVPVGNYPRLTSTFISASMFCNYLNVSLVLVFAAEKLEFIKKKTALIFAVLILICALFTISSGIGGIVLTMGFWFWAQFNDSSKLFAKFSLIGAVSFAILFFGVNFAALQKYPNAPFFIKIPFSNIELLPSPRFLVWSGSFQTFLDNFWNGRGLGEDVCSVLFQNTDGNLSNLSDAHNVFLSVAAQNGIFGLIAVSLIIFCIARKFSLKTFEFEHSKLLKNYLVLAFICAFFYQGLTGSFEDARHLWVLIGLILSAGHLNFSKTDF